MAEQWEKSVSLHQSVRAHSICPVDEVSLWVCKKNLIYQEGCMHACALCAQAIQKVKRLKVEVGTFIRAMIDQHSDYT